MNRKLVDTHTETAAKRKTSTITKKPQAKGKVAKSSQDKVLSELLAAGITPEQRSQMIAEAAYYRAEQRGFAPEGHARDWFEAEAEVDAMLNKMLRKKGTELSH